MTNMLNRVLCMDCLQGLSLIPDDSVDCCVTSPPYYALRDYGCEGQIGLEDSPEEYIARLTGGSTGPPFLLSPARKHRCAIRPESPPRSSALRAVPKGYGGRIPDGLFAIP